MAYVEQTKMVMGYNNQVRADLLTGVIETNFTDDTSFPVENLLYDDPWRMLKVSTNPSGDPTITFTFTDASTAIDCWGLCNHNLVSQGYLTASLERWTGSWSGVGSPVDLTSIPADANFLLRHDEYTAQQFRIVLTGTPTYPTFYIGAVFMGTYYEAATNTVDGLFNSQLEVPINIIDAAGGARYVVRAPAKFTHRTEATFERMSQAQAQTLAETITRNNLGRLVAIVPPDQVHAQLPPGVEHQYGYITSVTVAPRGGLSATTHKADVVLTIEGAV